LGKPSVEQANDAGSPHLYISASTLKPDHYTISVTVVATDETFRTTNAILAFAFVQAPLQAVIDGGGFQTVSFSKDSVLWNQVKRSCSTCLYFGWYLLVALCFFLQTLPR